MFNLEEALQVIKDRLEFSCNDRDFGCVIDYHVTLENSFVGSNPTETKILQNLRGTCFNKSGKIIRLAYHKFHNLNENEEYHESKFDFGQPHWIEEKLDGSMVTPIPYQDGTFRLGTRAGVTDVALKAEKFLQTLEPFTRSEYQELMFHAIKHGLTPIFEYCSRDQRIVIDYPEPALVLTGVRNNTTGEYLDIHEYTYGMNRIRKVNDYTYDGTIKVNIAELSKTINACKDEFEGVIVKFDDGRFVKIKTADYVLKHRAIDGLKFEKDVLKLILINELDDVLPLVTDVVHKRLISYRESVLSHLQMANKDLSDIWNKIDASWTRKEFAVYVQHFPYAKFLFAKLDGRNYTIEEHVLNHCTTQTTVESVRWLIGPPYNSF